MRIHVLGRAGETKAAEVFARLRRCAWTGRRWASAAVRDVGSGMRGGDAAGARSSGPAQAIDALAELRVFAGLVELARGGVADLAGLGAVRAAGRSRIWVFAGTWAKATTGIEPG